jgi:predicted Zn-dependent peptidase
LNSQFDAEELERERKVILQEISMVEEAPEELVHDLFFELIFPRHGLGRPILGTETSIRRMRRGDLSRYFHKHYRPDQVLVSVVGDVSQGEVLRHLKKLRRRDWPGRPWDPQTRRELGFEPAPKLREGRWWIVRPTEQVHLVWGVDGPRVASKDRYAAFLMNVYLGGGMSSALFQEIREKRGLAYTVYSSLSPFYDSGVFTIYAATNPNQVPLCLKLMDEACSRLKRELLSDAELQVIKDNLKGTIQLSEDSAESRMSSVAKDEIFFGTYLSLDEFCAEIDRVTPQEIRRVARKILTPGGKAILALGPRPSAAVRKKMKFQIPKRFKR